MRDIMRAAVWVIWIAVTGAIVLTIIRALTT